MTPGNIHLLGIGGAHVDRRGQVSGMFVPGASNPGTMREEVGGGVFNALRNVVRRGGHAALLSVRGGDGAGEAVARAIAEAGIDDLSAVFLDRSTPSYTALLDREGELLAGLADMTLYEMAFARQLSRSRTRDAVGKAGAILCDANLPEAALTKLASAAAGKPLFAIAISPAKVVRLKPVLPALACLFLNRREAAALTGGRSDARPETMVADLRRAGLERAVVTAGAGAIIAYDGDRIHAIDPPEPDRIVDVTGAGDALAGTAILSMLSGVPFPEAVRHGLAAAKLCIESAQSVPDHSEPAFSDALALVPEMRAMA
ncbi:carbohydrate kinase family protein [Aquibium sp. LZ166]|uniref:Carbohydrate kinase family protein n=1 Tax=Aquibium pacificus TaxID=3153579 RepID=A0ABV3SDX4_9HYPH